MPASLKRPRSPCADRPPSTYVHEVPAALMMMAVAVAMPTALTPVYPAHGTPVAEVVPMDVEEEEKEEWKEPSGEYAKLKGHIKLSSLGRIKTKIGNYAGRFGKLHRGHLHPSNYYRVSVLRKNYAVHELICTAFHGPKPDPMCTADHGPFGNPDSTDNRASNLRWATKKEQRESQGKHRKMSTGQPVLARRAGSDDEWVHYDSAGDAGKALGVPHGNIRSVVKRGCGTAGGYEFKTAPPRETQEDLPADGEKPAEQWKETSDRLRVSNRGRVQTKESKGTAWSHRRTPTPCARHVYTKVNYLGNGKLVHILVYELFGGRAPVKGETIDHIDQDPRNNSINNLRPATKSDQSLNRTLPPVEERALSHKDPVRGRPLDGSLEWETFGGQKEAARALNARYPDKKFYAGNISTVVYHKNGYTQTQGWVFERIG